MASSVEGLVEEIAEARRLNAPLSAGAPQWSSLDRDTAEKVASALYERWGAVGSPFWKLGAVDAPTQERFGLNGPVCGPLVPSNVRVEATQVTIARSDFIHAKFEAEVGVGVGADGELRAMPCVEVADSRFEGWKLPPFGVLADGALQGMMLFGPGVAPPSTPIHVDVVRDGVLLASGDQGWPESAVRLDVLPHDANATHVATGALTALFDVIEGEWTFDFGTLGRLVVTVQ
ncbi:MAG: hypothetical protein F2881_05950 [Actinobacteria bacterium]|uniref:Unannotated protein n=1 Tax=freshwater metagenome TaxID=449393 RepID=A0A6J7PX26_9ZZZZ|nr:hypothetical protein [Actinomycetota bacterium]